MTSHSYDIAIIGAGPAGIAAAIGASRLGARVRLIERDSTIGGSATNAMVGTLCGLARCGPRAPRPPLFDNPGFAAEFSKQVALASNTALTIGDDGLAYLPYRISALHLVATNVLKEPSTCALSLLSTPTSISRASPSESFEIGLLHHDGSTEKIRAQAIIDSTGHSLVSELLKLPSVTPTRQQAASLIFELTGLPLLEERALGVVVRKLLLEAVREGALPERLSYVSVVPGSLSNEVALFKLGTESPHGERTSTMTYKETTDGLPQIVSTLRQRSADFASVQLSGTAPRLGIRAENRGVGREELSEATVRLSERHINGIALGFWPAEMWSTPARPTVTFPERGDCYEIPLGSLCAKSTPGVYFAGRAISACDYAIASARVIGTCLSTGYAAGRIAAGALQGESEGSIVSSLRKEQVDPFYEVSATRL